MSNRLFIGYDHAVPDCSLPEMLQFSAGGRAFEYVATFLTALHGFATMAEVYQLDNERGVFPWAQDDVSLFDSLAAERRLVWSPHCAVNAMVRNRWPDTIEFTSYPITNAQRGQGFFGAIGPFIFGLSQSLLVNFFEDHKSYLKENYRSQKSWPEVWQFARVIRNAMSHGGALDIRDRTEVGWRGLKYAPSDNGKAVINSDILPGDLFVLIKDMEKAIGQRP